MDELVIYCADVGSVARGRFAWARSAGGGSSIRLATNIGDLAASLAADLTQEIPTTLGFECPLFVPLPADPERLTAARRGEGARPWSAGAGAAALATGLTEVCWVLREVKRQLGRSTQPHLDWNRFRQTGGGLFLWEAFVTGGAKGATDVNDAEIAVRAFQASLPDLNYANAIHEPDVYSLVGAALLRTGWSDDCSLLTSACVVIRA